MSLVSAGLFGGKGLFPGLETAGVVAALRGHGGRGEDDHGQRCGGDNGKCCSGLTCCTGVPVPAGQEYCAAICPKSDRNIKYNVRAVDEDKLLRQLMSWQISIWTYNNEPSRIRHIGPMAQDFKKVFGVGGDDDRFIAPVDADGVSLLAIEADSPGLTQEQLQRAVRVR